MQHNLTEKKALSAQHFILYEHVLTVAFFVESVLIVISAVHPLHSIRDFLSKAWLC